MSYEVDAYVGAQPQNLESADEPETETVIEKAVCADGAQPAAEEDVPPLEQAQQEEPGEITEELAPAPGETERLSPPAAETERLMPVEQPLQTFAVEYEITFIHTDEVIGHKKAAADMPVEE